MIDEVGLKAFSVLVVDLIIYYTTKKRSSNFLTELSTICRWLYLAWDLGYRYIIMESDYHTVLNLIDETNQNSFYPRANLLSLIRKLSSLYWVVSFNHTLREDNECVDWLTKFDVNNFDSLKMWMTHSQLNITLLADTSRVFRLWMA
jgi:hypothetical protein